MARALLGTLRAETSCPSTTSCRWSVCPDCLELSEIILSLMYEGENLAKTPWWTLSINDLSIF